MGCMRHGVAAASLLATLACKPDELEPAEHAEVCGEPGPLRILELDPDEQVGAVFSLPSVAGRRVLRVVYVDPTFDDVLVVARSETWTVGECGDSPRLLTTDEVTFFDHWPEQPFACDPETGELTALDLQGERSPNVAFSTGDCFVRETSRGLVEAVEFNEDFGAIVLLPFPDDPWAEALDPITLINPVRLRQSGTAFSMLNDVLAVRSDAVYAVTPDDELVRRSLVDETTIIEAADAREFDLSPDERFLLWQGTDISIDDGGFAVGPVFLRDRTTGMSSLLDDAPLTPSLTSPFQVIDHGLVQLVLGSAEEAPRRYYSLPSLESFDLPRDRRVFARIGDQRWLVGPSSAYGELAIFDLETGTTDVIFENAGTVAAVHDDRVEVLEKCCDGPSLWLDEGRLFSVGFDGTRRTLARRASYRFVQLQDGRTVSTVDVDGDRTGDFVVTDPATLDEHLVDHHVLAGLKDVDEEDDTILYAVEDGDRTGVWITKLAPRE